MTSFTFTDAEILRVTGYIKDNKYIASIYGVSIHKVKRLREQQSERADKSIDRRNLVEHASYDSSAYDEMHISNMERGSSRLRDGILAYFYDRNGRVVSPCLPKN